MVNWNSTIHVICPLAFMTYKYNELQVFGAIQILSCNASYKTPIFIIMKNNHKFATLECVK